MSNYDMTFDKKITAGQVFDTIFGGEEEKTIEHTDLSGDQCLPGGKAFGRDRGGPGGGEAPLSEAFAGHRLWSAGPAG